MSQDRQLNYRSVENQLEEKLERTRYLLDSGSYEESLGCLIDSFNEFKQLPSWIMTCITDETAKLGRKYPPARAVLEQRRDALERQIRSGGDEIFEWTTLNRCLGDSDREIQMLNTLSNDGILSEELKQTVISSNLEVYLREKKYHAIYECFSYFGRMFLYRVGHYEGMLHFPTTTHGSPRARKNLLEDRRSLRKRGAQLYEVALAVGDYYHADLILNKVLSIDSSASTYTKFLLAALRAGRAEIGTHILRRADNGFSEKRTQRLFAMLEKQSKLQKQAI